MNRTICILVGALISALVLYPLNKKRKARAKQQEKEAMKKVDAFVKEAMDEELKKEGDFVREHVKLSEKYINELHDKIENDYKNQLQNIMKIKYRDPNGEIHEIDLCDYDAFRKMMKNKNNTLILN